MAHTNTPIKNPDELNLYGIAIAAIPKKDSPNHINVIVSPISVGEADPHQITVLDHLKFKETIDLNDAASLRSCFIRVTKTLNTIVELQQQSLSRHKLPFRPVALEIGQDTRNPMPLDGEALFIQLFGRRASRPEHPQSMDMRVMNHLAARAVGFAFVEPHPISELYVFFPCVNFLHHIIFVVSTLTRFIKQAFTCFLQSYLTTRYPHSLQHSCLKPLVG